MKNRKIILLIVAVILIMICFSVSCTSLTEQQFEEIKTMDNSLITTVEYQYKNMEQSDSDVYTDSQVAAWMDKVVPYEKPMISYREAARRIGLGIEYIFNDIEAKDKELILDILNHNVINNGQPYFAAWYIEGQQYNFQYGIDAYTGIPFFIWLIDYSDKFKDCEDETDLPFNDAIEKELLVECINIAKMAGYENFTSYSAKLSGAYDFMLFLNDEEGLHFRFYYKNGDFFREFWFEFVSVDSITGSQFIFTEATKSMKLIPKDVLSVN